jgi:hypothetical protein
MSRPDHLGNPMLDSMLETRVQYPVATGLCTECGRRTAAIRVGNEQLCLVCDGQPDSNGTVAKAVIGSKVIGRKRGSKWKK